MANWVAKLPDRKALPSNCLSTTYLKASLPNASRLKPSVPNLLCRFEYTLLSWRCPQCDKCIVALRQGKAPSSKFLKHFVFRTRSVWLYFYYVYFYYDIPQHKGSFCWYTVFIEKWAYLAASLMLSMRTLKVYNPHYRVGQPLRPSLRVHSLFLLFLCPPA